MKSLYTRVVRLASVRADIRPYLLPLIKAANPTAWQPGKKDDLGPDPGKMTWDPGKIVPSPDHPNEGSDTPPEQEDREDGSGRKIAGTPQLDIDSAIRKMLAINRETQERFTKSVEGILIRNDLHPKSVWLNTDRGISIEGTFEDNAGVFRTKDELLELFEKMFGTSGQIYGGVGTWHFYMGEWYH